MRMAEDMRTWSFISLLIGGILILSGGLMGATMMGWGGWGMMDMMDGGTPIGWVSTMAWWMGIIGVVTGAAALVAAAMVYRGQDLATWGIVGIVAGALSLLAMGGYVIGAIAAIAGGALALVDAQRSRATELA